MVHRVDTTVKKPLDNTHAVEVDIFCWS